MGDIIDAMNRADMPIRPVSDDQFAQSLDKAMADEQKNMLVAGVISYLSHDENSVSEIGANAQFTIQALYRLGFKWPVTDEKYLVNALNALKTLRFF